MLDVIASGFYEFLNALNYNHPIHPTQVHIPVGMIVGAFILGLLGLLRSQSQFSRAAWYCSNIALAFMIPTVATGLMDWRHSYSGAFLFPFKAKFLLAALLLALLFAGFLIGRNRRGGKKGMLIIYTLSTLMVGGLGYFGGELVYGSRVPVASKAFQTGQELYAANCGGCHMNGGNSMNPKLPVKNSPKTSDLHTFISWLRVPKRPMPAFTENALSESEARDLFDYIVNVINK